MSDEDFERRINNKIETILETQARNDAEISKILEAVTGMIQLASIQDERIDRIEKQIEENGKQIAALIQQGKAQDERIDALAEQGKEQQGRIDALIRIVDGHVSNHP